MPNTVNVTKFAAQVRAIGVAAEQAQRKAVMDAALMLKRSIEQQTSIATKGSMGFSNMDTRLTRSGKEVKSNSPSRLRVGYDLVGERNPTALLVARGAWGLIEYGSDPHIITPRMSAIERKGVARKKYLRAVQQRKFDVTFNAVGTFSGYTPLNGNAGGGTPRYRVNHPGQKGKRPFARGIELARGMATRRARTIITNEVVQTVRSGRQQFTYIVGDNRVGYATKSRSTTLSTGRY